MATMVVPADVVAAAREGNFDVVAAYFASEPRDVEDDCEGGIMTSMPVPLLHAALAANRPLPMDQDGKYRIVEMLLALGADPNRRNGWGNVALVHLMSNCQVDCTPRLVKLLLESGADARVMGYERSGNTVSFIGFLLRGPVNGLHSTLVARPLKNHLEVLKMLLRAGASLENCRNTVSGDPTPKHAEWCIQKAETAQSALAVNADWIAMKAIVAGVRREGSWKAYCRVEHKRLIRLRSYLVRGYAGTTDARVDRILRLPNGACWNVLAYWREAA